MISSSECEAIDGSVVAHRQRSEMSQIVGGGVLGVVITQTVRGSEMRVGETGAR